MHFDNKSGDNNKALGDHRASERITESPITAILKFYHNYIRTIAMV